LPGRLAALGNRIKAHLERAERAKRHADNHQTSAAIYLAEAKKACDEGGFSAFRARFCPDLGRARCYELLAIANGTKSAEGIRAENAERNRRHRTAKKIADLVRHVTDAEPAAEPTPATTCRRRSSAEVRREQYQHGLWVLCDLVGSFCAAENPAGLDPKTAAANSDMLAEAIRRLRKHKAALDAVAQSGGERAAA
jgi:hypothetical protein